MLCFLSEMCVNYTQVLELLRLLLVLISYFRPHDTPFEDGTFKLTIEFTEEYPNKPPTVRFVSKMFHPNVYADGGICLDILQNRWSPTYDVSAILTSIQVSILIYTLWVHYHYI